MGLRVRGSGFRCWAENPFSAFRNETESRLPHEEDAAGVL